MSFRPTTSSTSSPIGQHRTLPGSDPSLSFSCTSARGSPGPCRPIRADTTALRGQPRAAGCRVCHVPLRDVLAAPLITGRAPGGRHVACVLHAPGRGHEAYAAPSRPSRGLGYRRRLGWRRGLARHAPAAPRVSRAKLCMVVARHRPRPGPAAGHGLLHRGRTAESTLHPARPKRRQSLGRVIPGYLADRYGHYNFLAMLTILSGIIGFCWTKATTLAGLVVWTLAYGFSSGVCMPHPPSSFPLLPPVVI